jgi:hydrogenase maturation protein HypF
LPRKHIAAAAQEAVAKGLADLAIEAAEKEGIKVIGASGGVFYNRAITSSIKKSVERAGLAFVMHRVLPPGDGCISAGQAVHASHRCD